MALRRAVLSIGDKLAGTHNQNVCLSNIFGSASFPSSLPISSQCRSLSTVWSSGRFNLQDSSKNLSNVLTSNELKSFEDPNSNHKLNYTNLVFKRYARTTHKSIRDYLQLTSQLAVDSVIPDVRTNRWADIVKGPAVRSCIPAIPEIPKPTEYKSIGTIEGPYSLNLERVFGVVELAGSQYKVTVDDVIFTNFLHGVEVNDVVVLERVMLLGSRDSTVIGRPYIPGACVLAAVEEHFLDGTVHVFKRKKRKRYRRYKPVRPMMTTLRILKVIGIEPAAGDELSIPNGPAINITNPEFVSQRFIA